MRYRTSWVPVAALLLLPGLGGHAAAAVKHQEPKKHVAAAAEGSRVLGTADSWSAYFYKDKAGPVCYLVGKAAKSEPASAKRQAPSAMVTHRPAEKAFNVVSFVEGYPLKDGSEVDLTVDGKKYDLFTKGDAAWSPTAETDKTITEALAHGHTATVQGTPRRGPKTTDTYSLNGFTKALDMINKACDVKQ